MGRMHASAAGCTRRRLLTGGLLGAAGLLIGPGLFTRLGAADALGAKAGKAKAVIQVWLWGGPCHLDTFDPKPEAGRDYCGPYLKPIDTNVAGIRLAQPLTQLATCADKFSLIRGMTHGNNGHETAAYLVQAGRKAGSDLVYPGLGALVSYFKGYRAGYKGMLPPYVNITAPQGRFSEAGFLGSKYKPFSTGGDPNKDPFVVDGVTAENITEARQQARRKLLREIDGLAREQRDDAQVKELLASQDQAYEMIMGDAGKAFLLKDEKPELRERYGRNTFGQSCLLARRLVERGVAFITINHGGWDTHKQHFQAMGRKLPELDAALATLIKDLAERNLLDSTIIWAGGEFGRTPKVLMEEPWNGGRSHYGKAFSTLMAGGGFKGGQVVGKTDEHGETVVERPVYPWDLHASMYSLLGIPADARIPTPQGEQVAVSPFTDKTIDAKQSGGMLKEIM